MKNLNKRKADGEEAAEVKRVKIAVDETILPAQGSTATAEKDLKRKATEGATKSGGPDLKRAKTESDLTTGLTAGNNDNKLKRQGSDDLAEKNVTSKRSKTKATTDDDSVTVDHGEHAVEVTIVSAGALELSKPTPDSRSAFTFFSLPAEIRLKIYGHLLKLRRPVYPQVDGLPSDKQDKSGFKGLVEKLIRSGFRKGLVASLVTTNKQLASEVLHFIYSNNCFRLTVPFHREWINRIGHPNSSLIKEVILVGVGRPQFAAEHLFAMLSTIWKRAPESLRHITVHDEWNTLDSAFIPQELLSFANKRGFKTFGTLDRITIDIPHRNVPFVDKPLYEKLCLKTKVDISGRNAVGTWKRPPLLLTPDGWRQLGGPWLNLAWKEMDKQIKFQREEAQRTAKLKKKEKTKVWWEKRARLRAEAQRTGLKQPEEQQKNEQQNTTQQEGSHQHQYNKEKQSNKQQHGSKPGV